MDTLLFIPQPYLYGDKAAKQPVLQQFILSAV